MLTKWQTSLMSVPLGHLRQLFQQCYIVVVLRCCKHCGCHGQIWTACRTSKSFFKVLRRRDFLARHFCCRALSFCFWHFCLAPFPKFSFCLGALLIPFFRLLKVQVWGNMSVLFACTKLLLDLFLSGGFQPFEGKRSLLPFLSPLLLRPGKRRKSNSKMRGATSSRPERFPFCCRVR